MIYLDWAATAPPCMEEITSANAAAAEYFANPSAVHSAGKAARALLEQARSRCAAVLNVPAETLYFTSGGSESNSLVLLSVLNRPAAGSLAVSAIEHPSVREQARVLQHCGWTVLTIPSNQHGIITPEAVLNTIRDDTVLAAVMTVNNEIGIIQPIAEISAALAARTAAGKRPVHFHTDAVQALGKLPLPRLALDSVHSFSMSAHKIGGPRGIGLLYTEQPLNSFIRGGQHERSVRPGTENVAGALALAACLEKNYADFTRKYEHGTALNKQLIEALREIPSCTLIPQDRSTHDERFSPWIVQASFQTMPAEVMLRCLSEKDIFISTGSACSSKKKNRPVLAALHTPPETAQNAVRISFGYRTTEADIDAFIQAVRDILA